MRNMEKKTGEKSALIESLIGNILETLVAYEHCAGVVNRVCHEMKLSDSQFMILNYVYDGGKSMGDIAYMLGVAKPNATPVVHTLETLGYIRRDQDKNDRRMMIITMTPEGKECHDVIYARLVEVIGHELGSLNMSVVRKANSAVAVLKDVAGGLMAPQRYKG